MKTTTFLTFICAFLFCSNPAGARIGETEEQIDHRYGKPAGKWDDYIGYKKLYHWHGFDVMVTFVDGVDQREMFNRSNGPFQPNDYKYECKVVGADKNGVSFDKESGAFTTKEFAEKYRAAKDAAWAKSNTQKQQ
jgi:hypothetical protein